MLNSEDSKKYRDVIEEVYPGFFKRVLDYEKNIQNTHNLLGSKFINSLKNNSSYEYKIDEEKAYSYASTFLKKVNANTAIQFARLIKNKEIQMIDINNKVGGSAKYNEATRKSKITINKTGNLIDASVILHEFMHLKTNEFSGISLKEKAENRKYQEELSIFIELCFIKFLSTSKSHIHDAKLILDYRLRTALLYSPGQMQSILTALYYADQNRPEEAFINRFGQFFNKLEFQIKHCLPMDIEEYYLGTMSAINNLDNAETKLSQIFELLDQKDFVKVKKLLPISYDAKRDCHNIQELYKIFEKIVER